MACDQVERQMYGVDGVVPGLRKAPRDSYLPSGAAGGGWGA
ncbi:hypothetical protein C5F59_003570 [Streptomyces sp. QL37]|nr:hypothetical protein [Streptomyces sp. QL37]